ncbi:hypothetical protein ABPG72_022351 [Tetrahymena utriculariae]
MSIEELRLDLQQLQMRQQEFTKIENNKENSDIISEQQYGNIIIYDEIEQKNKMLILCLSKEFEKYNRFYQEVTKKCIRADIYLKVLDQYYLDSGKLFYVFEMESFSSTFTEFKIQFQLEIGVIQDKFENILKNHPMEIIEIISNNHLYDEFEVQYSNEQMFELKAKKRGQAIQLQAHSFQNLQKAEETISNYNKILADQKINSTFLGAELFIFEKQNYILVEKKYFDYVHKLDFSINSQF